MLVPPKQMVANLLRLIGNKEFYKVLYSNFSGTKRNNTFAVIGSVCLFLSALLKSVGFLIESNKLAKWQKLLKIIRYNLYLLLRNRKLSPPQGRNISKTVIANYSNKYVVNNSQQVELNNVYKNNERLAENIYAYSKTLRAQYSFITNVQIFQAFCDTFSYIPDLLSMGQGLFNKLQFLKNIHKEQSFTTSFSPLVSKPTALLLLSNLQTINCFFLQLFQDLAFIGDQNLLALLTRHSLENWYISSKFWFLYVLVNIIQNLLVENTKKSSPASYISRFFHDNRKNLVTLVLAYHWGFDWSFLNDYQLSILNLHNYLPTFAENWSELYQLVKRELSH